uniref:Kelch-like protein n=1 Tax=Naegleria gruberi TaxID=5762 RepID=Q6QNF9_NAEGR|nr:kelch-like protein [Naegleria gruberi]
MKYLFFYYLLYRCCIGGSFSSLNGTKYNNIAYYDLKESALKALGNGTDGEVKVVNVDVFGNVYIGGSFTQVGSMKTGPVAVWNIYTSAWVSTGLTASQFSAGSVVTSLDTDCSSFPESASYTGLFPCDIFIGGNFKATLSGSTATNIMYYHNANSAWESFTAANVSSVSVIAKNELQLFTYSKVYIGGKFYDATGKEFGFATYDTDKKTWTFVDGVSGVTDIYYNPNVFSTDNIFVSATTFTETTCKGVCNLNHKTSVWSSTAGSVATGIVNKLRYIKGLSASNVGSIFIGGNGLSTSSVKRRDGETGDYATIGTNYPVETVLGMDICGILSQYSVTGCKSGSVAVGGQNFFKFFDANANAWKSLLSETGYSINSIYVKTSSAVTSTISFALMAIVAIVCFLF